MGTQDSWKDGREESAPAWAPFSRGARDWAWYLVGGVVLAAGLWQFDGAISKAARTLQLSGDVRRELEALAQYGQGAVSVLVATLIWMIDPTRRRRLLDWAAAALIAGAACMLMKLLLGRPRPLLEDPGVILGPWGMHPIPDAGAPSGYVLAHAWEWSSRVQYMLGSMPSRHTTFAAVLSVVLWTMYPRIRPLAIGMLALVGTMRVVTGAHYPSDVIVGAALGLAIGTLAMRRFWGTRALDRFWKKFVDREARPMLAPVVEVETQRLKRG